MFHLHRFRVGPHCHQRFQYNDKIASISEKGRYLLVHYILHFTKRKHVLDLLRPKRSTHFLKFLHRWKTFSRPGCKQNVFKYRIEIQFVFLIFMDLPCHGWLRFYSRGFGEPILNAFNVETYSLLCTWKQT